MPTRFLSNIIQEHSPQIRAKMVENSLHANFKRAHKVLKI